MGRPLKIVELGLEQLVLDGRERGLTLRAIAGECAEQAGVAVSKTAVERYLQTLDSESVAPAHAPQHVERNLQVLVDVGERVGALDTVLRRWLDEADVAVTPMRGVLWDPYLQRPAEPHAAKEASASMAERFNDAGEDVPEWCEAVQVMVPDWNARLGTANQLRKHVEAFVSLQKSIFDVEQVRTFQEAVVAAIGEADPGTQGKVLDRLRRLRDVRRAGMMGLDG